MSPVTALDDKLQPTKGADRLTCLQTHCVHWHFLSFSSLSLGGSGHLLWAWAGGHPCCAMERQRQRPRNEESFYQRFRLLETGLVLGRDIIRFSESSPENLTSVHTRASSQRALAGQQGHTPILAKHIKHPKIGRKDPSQKRSFRAPPD